MDVLGFIASLVSSLAWPVAAVLAVVILRKPLAGLIPLLQRLRYKGFELDFAERVHELEVELRETAAAVPEAPALPRPSPRTAEVARVSPRAAVLKSWREVEQAVGDLARKEELNLPDRRGPFGVIRALEKAGAIDSSTSSTIHELRSLRDEAAHAPEFAFDLDAALAYDEVASRVTSILQRSTGDFSHD